MPTRPHNGWWKASNASRRWLDQLKATPSNDDKFTVPADMSVAPVSAVPRLHVLEGRLQQY